jgi:hypothetical protein
MEPTPDAGASAPDTSQEGGEGDELAAIELQLARPDISDRARQALVAQRLRLRRSAEDKAKGRRLRQLLSDHTVAQLIGALRRPADDAPASAAGEGAVEAGGAAAELAARHDDVEQLLSSELGRAELGLELEKQVMGGDGGGAATTVRFPAEGFDGLCRLVHRALDHMKQAGPPIFDALVVCRHPPLPSAQGSAHGSIVHHVEFPRKGAGSTPTEPPGGVEHFCFPVHPGLAPPPEHFTIVRTLDDGTRQYGFCRYVPLGGGSRGGGAEQLQPAAAEVLCLLSRQPWFSLCEGVMGLVTHAHTAGDYAAAEQLLGTIFAHTVQNFPMPGERFTIDQTTPAVRQAFPFFAVHFG